MKFIKNIQAWRALKKKIAAPRNPDVIDVTCYMVILGIGCVVNLFLGWDGWWSWISLVIVLLIIMADLYISNEAGAKLG